MFSFHSARLPASAWAGLGAAATAAYQAAVVVLIARFGGAAPLGRYGLAAALVAPLMLTARMQLRTVVAAEGEGSGDARTFFATRLAASVLALAAAAFAGLLLFDRATAAVVACLAAERAAYDLAELAWGFEQRRGCWPRIFASQGLHAVAGTVAVGCFLASGSSIPASLGAAAAAHVVLFALVDAHALSGRSRSRAPLPSACLALARRCGWLAPAAALVSLTGHLPRFALEQWADVEAVGRFAALAQLTLLGNLAVQALGQAALSPLARADPAAFRVRLAALTRRATALAVPGAAAAALWGDSLLGLLYGPAFADLGGELAALAAASVFLHWAGVWGYALAALGERRLQAPVYLAATAASALVGALAVPPLGLQGGIVAYAAGWAVAAAGCAYGIRRAAITRRPHPAEA